MTTAPGETGTAGTVGGLHICHVADEASLSVSFLESFTRCGLAKRERMLWLVEADGDGPLARAAEAVVGSDGAALAAIDVGVAEDAYLADGRVDPDRMLARYRAELDASREAGYAGVRVVADATWLVDRPDCFETFLSYEQRVSDELGDGFTAVCHYDADRLPPGWARAIRDAHPVEARSGPAPRLSAGSCEVSVTDQGCLGVSGDIDSADADVVRALLSERAVAGGDLHLDASGLRFIDVAGTRALVEAARGMGGRRMIIHGAPRNLRVILELTGWASEPALVLTDSVTA